MDFSLSGQMVGVNGHVPRWLGDRVCRWVSVPAPGCASAPPLLFAVMLLLPTWLVSKNHKTSVP